MRANRVRFEIEAQPHDERAELVTESDAEKAIVALVGVSSAGRRPKRRLLGIVAHPRRAAAELEIRAPRRRLPDAASSESPSHGGKRDVEPFEIFRMRKT